MVGQFVSLVRDERGIQHAEEALLLALIAVALITAAGFLKGKIEGVFNAAGNAMVIP